MTRPARFLIGGVILGAVVAGWLWSRTGGERVAIDLIEAWSTAKQRLPAPDQQAIIDAAISGDTRKAISINPGPSRIAYDVTVPNRAWLKFSVAMLEKSWTVAGDGVTIFIYAVPLGPDGNVTMADGRMVADELLSLTVNPYGNPADKLWHDLAFPLEKYAGKRIELRFVTVASPTNNTTDLAGDFLVWGQPRIVVN
jgi:hypothetical protein